MSFDVFVRPDCSSYFLYFPGFEGKITCPHPFRDVLSPNLINYFDKFGSIEPVRLRLNTLFENLRLGISQGVLIDLL